jgi:hypothetical protein
MAIAGVDRPFAPGQRMGIMECQSPKQLVGHLFAAVGDESLASIVERMEPELS